MQPECGYGYPWNQLEDELDPDTFKRLEKFMRGQTMALCGSPGRTCSRGWHMGVVYTHDYDNFTRGGPILD